MEVRTAAKQYFPISGDKKPAGLFAGRGTVEVGKTVKGIIRNKMLIVVAGVRLDTADCQMPFTVNKDQVGILITLKADKIGQG